MKYLGKILIVLLLLIIAANDIAAGRAVPALIAGAGIALYFFLK